MRDPSLLAKKIGMINTLLRLTKDSLKPKYIINGDYQQPKIYPPTNLEAARKAHQEHINSLKVCEAQKGN